MWWEVEDDECWGAAVANPYAFWINSEKGAVTLPKLPTSVNAIIRQQDGYVTVTVWVRGTEIVLCEPVEEFPSETLLAQIMLVA